MGLLAVNKDLMLPNHKQRCVREDDLFLMEIEHGGRETCIAYTGNKMPDHRTVSKRLMR